jgi:hypothetical protein
VFSWVLFTPSAWNTPVETFCVTFLKFSSYNDWNGTMVFDGNLITCLERPWYYLFVWLGISIPLPYHILFLMGHVYIVPIFLKSQSKWRNIFYDYKWLMCSLMFFWGAIGAVIILNSRIYVEWRHMYFIFVPFCCIVVYGLEYLFKLIDKKVILVFGFICLGVQICWIIKNHPYQYVYFNAIGKHLASRFDRDSWRVANYNMLKWLTGHENGMISVYFDGYGLELLDSESGERIERINDPTKKTEYVIENYRNIIGNTVEYETYEEIYTIWVDDFKIGSIFHRIEDSDFLNGVR